MKSCAMFFVFSFVLLTFGACVIESQPVIHYPVFTPGDGKPGVPNSILGTASHFGSALLNASTPALLWGIVPSSSIAETCDVIVQTGTHKIIARIESSGAAERSSLLPDSIVLKLIATGGCKALPDSSQTQFLFEDEHERRIAVVCPWSNAGELGCEILITGCDVDALDNPKLQLFGQERRNDGCFEGLNVMGETTGPLDKAACAKLGPIAPFCQPGDTGAAVAFSCTCEKNCCNSCFPGSAKVELATGKLKQMNELVVGDKIAVEINGRKEFQDVYAFGHKDKKAFSEFVKIHTSDNKTLELSRNHFVPTLSPSGVLYKRAQDVKFGDTLMVAESSSNTLTPREVTEVSTSFSEGLFNPFTMAGTILVDGVVASVHSDWFLDNMFDALGLTHMLPAAYQCLLLPARILYRIMKGENYVALYNWIDSWLDIAETGTKFGGTITAATALVLIAAVMTRKY